MFTAAGFVWYFDVAFSLVPGLIFLSLLLFISIYWTVIPLALYQHYGEQRRTVEINEWPTVTAVIPAYNEEGYVGRCIDSVLATNYLDESFDIVVVDDGSTDGTLAEIRERESDRVRVIQKENEGKHEAMNTALSEIDSDLIVSVDADSVVDAEAVKELVTTYKWHNEPCAVAGNIKIMHRHSALERIQALEYIVSINMFRRALDHLGIVNVVPGCLGLFEREAVTAVGGFSGDTVTEDFDFTLSVLKQGRKVHYCSTAISRTEAPQSLRGLYNQRLRWYRGTIQTLRKHKDIVMNTNYGPLHIVLMPYMWMSVGMAPILGAIVSAAIIWTSLFGSVVQVLGLIAIFVILEALFATTAMVIEDSIEKEDYRLLRYTPLMVIGYKQLQDFIMLRSLFDVVTGRRVSWTSAGRSGPRSTDSRPDPATSQQHQSKAKVEVYRDKASEWRWRLVHQNGNIIARSLQSYPERSDAKRDIGRIRETCVEASVKLLDETTPELPDDGTAQPHFEVYRDRSGEWRWRFVDEAGAIMADSGEGYNRKEGVLNGLDSVQTNIFEAPTVRLEPSD
ncbi:glycosyltransferase [Halovenus marina]|uniref:glycosyltransferase n=1 Tax=Halovenus marina TaxID=3396621 RepID=UPI003F55B24C